MKASGEGSPSIWRDIVAIQDLFRRVAAFTSEVVGSAWSFVLAILVILVWAGSGPMFHYSDTWQLVINTGTTIITFLMVFLIQNTQNRDSKVIHLKLDELLRAMKHARTKFAELEHLTDAELHAYEQEFLDICAREKIQREARIANRAAAKSGAEQSDAGRPA